MQLAMLALSSVSRLWWFGLNQ